MSLPTPLGATPDGGQLKLARGSLPRSRATQGLRRRARLGTLGLVGVLASGLLLTLAAAHTDSLLPESVRPIPDSLAGPLGSSPVTLGTVALLATLALMFACWVLAAACARYLSPRAVLMAIAALHVLVLLAPPLLSTDVFSYQAYARIGALYGGNPYLQGPHVIALDPIYPFIGSKWVSVPTAYGPLFTMLSYALAPLSIPAGILAYKAIAAGASLTVVALVWHSARLRGTDQVRAIALVGLNPLVVLYGVGGAHNDLLMLALMLGGIYLLLRHHSRAAAGSMVGAAAAKLTAGLYLPFALAGAGGPRTLRPRHDFLIGAAVAASCALVLSLVVFGGGILHMPAAILTGQSHGDWHSLPGFIATKLGSPVGGHIAGACLGGVFAVMLLFLVHRVWSGRLDWLDGAAWLTVVLLFTASALLPWYVAWLLPLVALAQDPRLVRAGYLVTGIVMAIQVLGYIPHGA